MSGTKTSSSPRETEHRRFGLAIELKRDIHQQRFRAFSSLAFHDDSWWTDEDLKFLVAKGRSINQAQQVQEKQRQELRARDVGVAVGCEGDFSRNR